MGEEAISVAGVEEASWLRSCHFPILKEMLTAAKRSKRVNHSFLFREPLRRISCIYADC